MNIVDSISKQSRFIIGLMLAVVLGFACFTNEQGKGFFPVDLVSDCISPLAVDSLVELYQWAMSTGDPAWQDSSEFRIIVGLHEALQLEIPDNLLYIIPNNLVVNSDRIFIMDNSNKVILCYSHDGHLLWSSGRAGEGPGEYIGPVKLSLGQDILLARDASQSRIDSYSLNGELQYSSVIQYVQYAMPDDNGNCIAFSCLFDEGVVCLFDSNGSALSDPWGDDTERYQIPYFPYYRYGVMSDTSQFAVASYKHTYLLLGSIDGTFRITERELPYSVDSEIRYASKNGTQGIQAIPLTGSVFLGPHGMINIQRVVPDPGGSNPISISGSETDYSLVDRFSWDGNYLDSYIIPKGNIWSIGYSNNFLYAVGHDENVYRFPISFSRVNNDEIL